VGDQSSEDRGTERAQAYLRESIAVTAACLDALAVPVAAAARLLIEALAGGGKVVCFGNGGSAADAQHLAADFVGKFMRERRPLAAVALTADTAVLTAVGNDYGFERVFARQVEALVREGDIVIALSTSGRSQNVIEGVAAARRARARVVVLTGRDGGRLAELADVAICVPSDHTGHIQEAHIAVGHALCALIDEAPGATG
jgi:D-sedoheptulose 7-phosphate isomerase